jgi:hypothetical protein
MSKRVTVKSNKLARRLNRPNTMAFPRELREAIPDLPTYVGRVLELDSVTGKAIHTWLTGRAVLVKLSVKETGRLKGKFVVRLDLQVEAARALAATLSKLADEAEAIELK